MIQSLLRYFDTSLLFFKAFYYASFDAETKETAVAEFNTSYKIGDEDHEVSIRCIYGDWFGLVDGSNYLPISVDCLKKTLNDFASFSAWQEVTEM